MRAALLFTAAVIAAAPAFAQPAEDAGRPIVNLIERLRDAGARIVYSEDLLPARLRAMAEPTAVEPFDQLREIRCHFGVSPASRKPDIVTSYPRPLLIRALAGSASDLDEIKSVRD